MTEKKSKKLINFILPMLANLIFFGLMACAFYAESNVSGLIYSAVGMIYMLFVPFYGLWFGYFSYKKTRSFILTLVMIGVANCTFFVLVFMWMYEELIKSLPEDLISAIFTSLPLTGIVCAFTLAAAVATYFVQAKKEKCQPTQNAMKDTTDK